MLLDHNANPAHGRECTSEMVSRYRVSDDWPDKLIEQHERDVLQMLERSAQEREEPVVSSKGLLALRAVMGAQGESDAGAGPDPLAQFLTELGLERYLPRLRNEELDLSSLRFVTERDLEEIGLPKGPRVLILHKLRDSGNK